MGIIHLLDANVRELISAGEVVERPASVVKELIENSLDAGATKIEVELKRNGLGAITVTDNGKGIDKEDIPYAFLRHATSKIEYAEDLNCIGTLGFRGEALAAICAVSKVRLITRTAESPMGYLYTIEGGQAMSLQECGAPLGTSITVSDLFYNTPARMKFLKKDVSEGNAVENVIWHVALTNPSVSFKLIRDGKQTLRTSGQGLYSAIFDLFPRETAGRMIPVSFKDENVLVEGYVSSPDDAKASRNLQHICVNGRYIKSRTIQSAVEEAYRSFIMQGKFPGYVLSVWIPYEEVDVNVHPAKTEIRFTNERAVSSAAYKAVRTAIASAASKAVLDIPENAGTVQEHPEAHGKAADVAADAKNRTNTFSFVYEYNDRAYLKHGHGIHPDKTLNHDNEKTDPLLKDDPLFEGLFYDRETNDSVSNVQELETGNEDLTDKRVREQQESKVVQETLQGFEDDAHEAKAELKAIGTLFDTYIISQYGDEVYFIDMHAAHERILYEQLRTQNMINSQMLLDPVVVSLSRDEKESLTENENVLLKLGFVVESIGEREIVVRGIPTYLKESAAEDAVTEIAAEMASGKEDITFEAREWLYHSMACRAAIKAGHKCPEKEMISLTAKILCGDVPKYCPHGRPVYFRMTKSEIEKKFGRIV